MANLEYINKKRVKQLALNLAEKRAHTFTRVSQEFLEDINTEVFLLVDRRVKALPSKGKTIK